MATLDSLITPGVSAEVDKTFAALRQSRRPLEFNRPDGSILGGHYSVANKTGAATIIAAAGSIWAMRHNDPSRFHIPLRIKASFVINTAFTTSQIVDLDVVRVTAMAAADTGGTAIAIGTSGRKRSTMNASQVNDMRIATTAALTNAAAPATADANPFAIGALGPMQANNAIGSFSEMKTIYELGPDDHPIVLAATEGLRIRIATTMGAAGVGVFTVQYEWAEVAAY